MDCNLRKCKVTHMEYGNDMAKYFTCIWGFGTRRVAEEKDLGILVNNDVSVETMGGSCRYVISDFWHDLQSIQQ